MGGHARRVCGGPGAMIGRAVGMLRALLALDARAVLTAAAAIALVRTERLFRRAVCGFVIGAPCYVITVRGGNQSRSCRNQPIFQPPSRATEPSPRRHGPARPRLAWPPRGRGVAPRFGRATLGSYSRRTLPSYTHRGSFVECAPHMRPASHLLRLRLRRHAASLRLPSPPCPSPTVSPNFIYFDSAVRKLDRAFRRLASRRDDVPFPARSPPDRTAPHRSLSCANGSYVQLAQTVGAGVCTGLLNHPHTTEIYCVCSIPRVVTAKRARGRAVSCFVQQLLHPESPSSHVATQPAVCSRYRRVLYCTVA